MVSLTSQVACFLSSGEEFLRKEDYIQALNLFENALAIAQQNQDSQAETLALQRLGAVHLVQEQPQLALASVEQALAIALEQKNLYSLYDCHRQLAQIQKALGDFNQSLQHFEVAESVREEILQNQAHPAIRYAYPAMAYMLGFANCEAFLQDHAPNGEVNRLKWQQYLNQAEQTKGFELKMTCRDGQDIWVRMSATLVTDSEDQECFYEGSMEDIADIKVAYFALEELAVRDPLTHVFNRRHFFELANREISRADRFKRPLSLVMVDIDHFKTINDEYGHWLGDEVLQATAVKLQNNLRQSDILARYGGEEFIILMPETPQSQAWNGAERLRRVISHNNLLTSGKTIPVTASVGITSWAPVANTGPASIEELIKQADRALYRAKQAGRNRTFAYSTYPSS